MCQNNQPYYRICFTNRLYKLCISIVLSHAGKNAFKKPKYLSHQNWFPSNWSNQTVFRGNFANNGPQDHFSAKISPAKSILRTEIDQVI